MELKTVVSRAKRGFREDLRLYLVAVSSLAVAFLCLAGALLAIDNMSVLADQWGTSRRMTVYLRDGAALKDVEELRVLLEGLPGVERAGYVSSAEARRKFLEQADLGGDLAALPADAFPASLEVELLSGVAVQRLEDVSARVARFGVVEDVETYRSWFTQLESLVETGRGVAGALALLVILCALAVVGNTIRLAIAGRRSEIEVMKLCGATDAFVRWPFVVEGAVQGFAAAALALLVLTVSYVALRSDIDATVASFTGVRTVFLHPASLVALLLGGGVMGAIGSVFSVRRYLAI
ncbi:MAG: permease-like cell division protein FtsX [Polyangiales bacterium]|nr:permease-like cell division protein FtsX [Myxococcales bacterium]